MEKIPINKIISDTTSYSRSVYDDKTHKGIDLVAKLKPVFAPVDAYVYRADANNDSNAGKNIILYSKALDVTFRFLHLSEILVKTDQSVKAGTQIGISGNTNGTAKGGSYHLHLEMWKGKKYVFDKSQNDDLIEPLNMISGLVERFKGKDQKVKQSISNSESSESLLSLMRKISGEKTKEDNLNDISDELDSINLKSPFSNVKHNNWTSIRHSKVQKWLGEIGALDGFVVFEKPEYSIRALYKILASYAKRDVNTIDRIAHEYVKKGGDPEKYVRQFLTYTRSLDLPLNRTTKLDSRYYPHVAKIFTFMESSKDKPLDYFINIYKTLI